MYPSSCVQLVLLQNANANIGNPPCFGQLDLVGHALPPPKPKHVSEATAGPMASITKGVVGNLCRYLPENKSPSSYAPIQIAHSFVISSQNSCRILFWVGVFFEWYYESPPSLPDSSSTSALGRGQAENGKTKTDEETMRMQNASCGSERWARKEWCGFPMTKHPRFFLATKKQVGVVW